MATIQKRGKPGNETFSIIVSLGYTVDDDNDGRPVKRQLRKSTTFKPPAGTSPAKALKLAEAAAYEFEQRCKGLTDFNENMTFGALCDWFFETIAPNKIRERTKVGYERNLRSYVMPTLRNVKLKDISAARLDTLFADLAKSGAISEYMRLRDGADLSARVKNKSVATSHMMGVSDVVLRKAVKGEAIRAEKAECIAGFYGLAVGDMFAVAHIDKSLSGGSLHGIVTALSSVFQSAYKAGIVKENIMRRTTPPRPPSKAISRDKFLTREQARKFLYALDGLCESDFTFKAVFALGLYMGVRSGEARALHWDDIDFDSGVLHVRHGLYRQDGQFVRTPPKNESSHRANKMPPELVWTLREYKDWQDEQKAASGKLWVDNNIVFANTKGGYLDHSHLNNKMKRICADNGLPLISFHKLRHTCASLLYDNLEQSGTIAKYLGHSETSTTERVYIHVYEAAQANAAISLELALREREMSREYQL